jgi:hypothetical protein
LVNARSWRTQPLAGSAGIGLEVAAGLVAVEVDQHRLEHRHRRIEVHDLAGEEQVRAACRWVPPARPVLFHSGVL